MINLVNQVRNKISPKEKNQYVIHRKTKKQKSNKLNFGKVMFYEEILELTQKCKIHF